MQYECTKAQMVKDDDAVKPYFKIWFEPKADDVEAELEKMKFRVYGEDNKFANKGDTLSLERILNNVGAVPSQTSLDDHNSE